jgi:EPS-associated MarR family transcriptional regulator
MSSKRSNLQEDTHFRVLRLLQDNPEMSQRELAAAVGISVGSVHYVLTALLEKGMIKLGNFTAAPDKRRYAYILTPKGIAEKAAITKRFLARKMAEYEALRAEILELRSELDEGIPMAPSNKPE